MMIVDDRPTWMRCDICSEIVTFGDISIVGYLNIEKCNYEVIYNTYTQVIGR